MVRSAAVASGGELAEVTRGRVASRTVLGVASFGAFLAFLDATIVNVAFPSIRESFPQTSLGTLSWVLNAYNIVFAAFLVPCGRLADLLGRKKALVWGVLVFTGASLLCALAPSVGVLIAARMVQALGAAILVPASLALVVQAFTPEHRTHAVGLWGASAALAAGLGPPIGGLLVELGGWRWAFLVNLPFGLAAWVLARRTLVESRAPGRRTMPDLRGAGLIALALGLFTLVLVQGNDWGWLSPEVLAGLAAAILAFVGFVWSSRRHRSPLLDPELLRVRPFVVGNAATVTAGMGFYAYLLTSSLWLTYVWGYSVLRAGLALVPAALIAAVVAALLGPIAARLGYLRFIVPGALVWAGSYAWYATQVGTSPAFVAEWLPGQVLSGIGVGMTLPLLGSAALSAVPGGRYATASALVSSSRQVGGVLGIAVLVVILGTATSATVEDLRTGWWMSVACFVATALIALLLGRIDPAVEQVDDPGATRVDVHAPGDRAADGVRSLDAIPLFTTLPPGVRSALVAAARPIQVQAGEWLFRAGDAADSVYVVTSGRLEVLAGDRVIRELGSGAVVGELSLLTEGTRSASVRARRDSTLREVARTSFEAAMASDPVAYPTLARGLAESLRSAAPPPRPGGMRPHVVAVVGVHPGAPVDAVAEALVASLARHLRAERIPDPDPQTLERAESRLDRVVLVAGAQDPSRDTCLRQADLVVLVAAADAPVPPVADQVGTAPGAPDLVLVGARPSEQAITQWCDALDPWQVTSVPDGVPADGLRALAARIAGASVGIVLAGGGARAFAHVGVLQELAAAGIRVDRVAGCSLGSVIAAFHAAGLDARAMEGVLYDEFVRRNPFNDYTLPTASLAKGKRARRAIHSRLGGREIRALPHQFRCNSVDLLGRAEVAHRSGDLADAVAASVSLPVLFPPKRLGDRLLIDGGVLDNLPVGLLSERDEGPLLAVNIAMGGGGGGGSGSGGSGNGGGRRTGPPRIPPLGDTLLRTMMIGSGGAVQAARDAGAYVVTPPPMGVGLLEFHQFDTVVEAGRRAARELLKAVGDTLPTA